MHKKISVPLTPSGIRQAIRELEAYKKEILRKTELLKSRVAEALREEAQTGFDNAMMDNRLTSGMRSAIVDVTVEENGSLLMVVARGEDAVWVEFGAGVYHNGSPGSSPHPKGAELGFTIGSYGQGKGKREVWGYYDGSELILTHGTPARMPMYYAWQQTCGRIHEIAREVFDSD